MTDMMKVRYQGQLYNSIQEAAAAHNLDPASLHKEFVQASITGERWFTDEDEGYISDEEGAKDPNRSGKTH